MRKAASSRRTSRSGTDAGCWSSKSPSATRARAPGRPQATGSKVSRWTRCGRSGRRDSASKSCATKAQVAAGRHGGGLSEISPKWIGPRRNPWREQSPTARRCSVGIRFERLVGPNVPAVRNDQSLIRREGGVLSFQAPLAVAAIPQLIQVRAAGAPGSYGGIRSHSAWPSAAVAVSPLLCRRVCG